MIFQGLFGVMNKRRIKKERNFCSAIVTKLDPLIIKSFSADARNTQPVCCLCKVRGTEYVRALIDKGPRLSIRIDIWILLSDTVCQLNQFHTSLWH